MINRILAGQVVQATFYLDCRSMKTAPIPHCRMHLITVIPINAIVKYRPLSLSLPSPLPPSTMPLPPRRVQKPRRARPRSPTSDATPQRVPHSHVTAAPIHGLPILSRPSAWTPPRSPHRSRAATSGCSAAHRFPPPAEMAAAQASTICSATTGFSDAAGGGGGAEPASQPHKGAWRRRLPPPRRAAARATGGDKQQQCVLSLQQCLGPWSILATGWL